MVNEDANAKLIRELKEEIQKLRELLKSEGIEVQEGSLEIVVYQVCHGLSNWPRKIAPYESKCIGHKMGVRARNYVVRLIRTYFPDNESNENVW